MKKDCWFDTKDTYKERLHLEGTRCRYLSDEEDHNKTTIYNFVPVVFLSVKNLRDFVP